MAFFLGEYFYDKGTEALNAARPSHRDYLNKLVGEGKVVIAGPYADGNGGRILYRAADAAEVAQLIANDPYVLMNGATPGEPREWNIVIHEPDFS